MHYPLNPMPQKDWQRISTYIAGIALLIAIWAGIASWVVVPGVLPTIKQWIGQKLHHDITGTWVADTKTGKQYLIVQTNQQLDVYLERKRIGNGTVTGDSVQITLWMELTDGSRTETRMAQLSLTLSSDQEKLIGSFKGADSREFGTISLRRLVAG